MARLDKEFYEWKFSNIKDAKTYNDEDYTSKLGEGNSLEFIYPTARPFSTLTKSFSKLASNYRNQTFQRIVIPLNESGEIHFLTTTQEPFIVLKLKVSINQRYQMY